MITQQKIKKFFHYSNGNLIWKIANSNRIKIGNIAGGISKRGYIVIRFHRKIYYAHRLIWLYHYGYFPESYIDHVNKNKIDNNISNLREVSSRCNIRNASNNVSNKSGVKGVFWSKHAQKWTSQIRDNDKTTKYLGYYIDFHEAVLARLSAEQCLGWQICDICSPAYQYTLKHKLVSLQQHL